VATYLITGASRGIGLEYCRQLQARGDEAIAVCRTPSDDLEKLGVRVESGVDVTRDADVENLAARLEGTTIDVLVNNAGTIASDSLGGLDFDALRAQFEVNSLGPLRVTRALLPLLAPDAKVVIMTSRMGSIEDNTSGGFYGYRMSKAAVSMAGRSLAMDLRDCGIPVAILHPGMVQTRMTGFSGITTAESVRGLLQRIDELTLKNTGTFWHARGEVLPW